MHCSSALGEPLQLWMRIIKLQLAPELCVLLQKPPCAVGSFHGATWAHGLQASHPQREPS